MAHLELRGVSRRFPGGDRAALSSLDLDAAKGELVVLVGPSGCGKSTALRLIAGLDRPDAGTIKLAGQNLEGVPPQARDVAMVFQGYALYPHKTARENIAFPLEMRGVARAERDKKVKDAAALLDIERLLDRRPGELSGGERQRVAMGRAIVRDPKLFLFDEPLSNLDAALRSQLRVDLTALVRRLGTTSLYVTHDQTEAMTMADRIAVLSSGELQQIGAPRDVYEDPANRFVAEFLGAPKINMLPIDNKNGTWRGAGTLWPVSAPTSSREILAGVRPEWLLPIGQEIVDRHCILRGKVSSREPLGAETCFTVECDGEAIRARAPGFGGPERGETAALAVDLNKVLWFDAKSGKRLRDVSIP